MIDKLTEQNSQMACLLEQVSGALMMLPQLIPATNLSGHKALEKIMVMLHDGITNIMYDEPKPTASCCSAHAGGYEECKTGCVHETISKIKPYKCTKCGEFYK